MDRISVSVDGLHDAHNALQYYMEQMQEITNTYVKLLSGCQDALDQEFRKDVMAYAGALEEFQRKINHFTEENQRAIIERMHALAGYCSTTYQKRTI